MRTTKKWDALETRRMNIVEVVGELSIVFVTCGMFNFYNSMNIVLRDFLSYSHRTSLRYFFIQYLMHYIYSWL